MYEKLEATASAAGLPASSSRTLKHIKSPQYLQCPLQVVLAELLLDFFAFFFVVSPLIKPLVLSCLGDILIV